MVFPSNGPNYFQYLIYMLEKHEISAINQCVIEAIDNYTLQRILSFQMYRLHTEIILYHGPNSIDIASYTN